MSKPHKPAANDAFGSEPFSMGAAVRVRLLGKIGVVSKLYSNGRYKVTVGSLSITCEASELTLINSKQPLLPSRIQVKIPKIKPPPATLDLHGDTVEEAVRKLDQWIDRALLAGLSQIKVIHGYGTGKVQRAVHERLKTLGVVVRFHINSFNPGETTIYL